MPDYRVNKDAVAQARKLIDAGKYDDDTEWSDAAPSADDEQRRDREARLRGLRRLAPRDRSRRLRGDQGPLQVPVRRLPKVNRAALIHAKQRAAQNDHDEIEKAADELLQHLDEKRDG